MCEEHELTLWRERRLRFVEEKQTGSYPIL
jgi:hypothetical protein